MYYPQTVLTNESPQVPQRGPYGERYPLTGHFYISLNISLFIFALRVPGKGAPSMFPNRGTPSPKLLVYLFIHVDLQESQKRSPPTYGKKHKVTVHGASRRWKAYIQWGAACFPKGIVDNTAISTPVPCSLWHTFHLGLGRPQPRQPAYVIATLIRVYPPQLLPPPT